MTGAKRPGAVVVEEEDDTVSTKKKAKTDGPQAAPGSPKKKDKGKKK
jgi:hypothetical protein